MIQKKKVNGSWETDSNTLKTDITVTEIVDIPPIVPGDTVLVACPGNFSSDNSSTMAASGASITIPRSGTFRIKWYGATQEEGGSTTSQIYLTRNGTTTAIGSVLTARQESHSYGSLDYEFRKGDIVSIYNKTARVDDYTVGYVGGLCACIDWNNGF